MRISVFGDSVEVFTLPDLADFEGWRCSVEDFLFAANRQEARVDRRYEFCFEDFTISL